MKVKNDFLYIIISFKYSIIIKIHFKKHNNSFGLTTINTDTMIDLSVTLKRDYGSIGFIFH